MEGEFRTMRRGWKRCGRGGKPLEIWAGGNMGGVKLNQNKQKENDLGCRRRFKGVSTIRKRSQKRVRCMICLKKD